MLVTTPGLRRLGLIAGLALIWPMLAACQGSQGTAADAASASAPRAPAASAASKAGGAQAGSPVRIGVAVAQTSNVALLGQEQIIGARLAQDFFNARGGVNGRPVEILIQDTGGDEQGAINAFTAVIADGVAAILGPTLSQQAFAADPLADRAGVPVIGPSNTAKGVPQIGEYVARVSAPVATVAPHAVTAALRADPHVRRVAVFYAQNDAFSTSESETFRAVVKDLGLDVVTVQRFQTTDIDFQAQITHALRKHPDLAIVSGLAADGGNLIRQLRELGFRGTIIGGNGLNTVNLFPVCQAYCDGILIAQAYNPDAAGALNRAFVEAYERAQGKQPPQFSAQAFTGIQVIIEALAAVDRETPLDGLSTKELRARLNRAILAGSYQSPLGPISFDAEGEIRQRDFHVARIEMLGGTRGRFTFGGQA